MAKLISIETAVPKHTVATADLLNFYESFHDKNSAAFRKLKLLLTQNAIESRASVLPDFTVPPKDRVMFNGHLPTVDERGKYFKEAATRLGAKALLPITKQAQITHLISVSCTGVAAPGLDLWLMKELNLPTSINRTSVNFMGCYAAIHALKMAASICKSNPDAAVAVVCVELCTLHFSPQDNDDQLLSTALFADGAAAALMVGEKHKLYTHSGWLYKDNHSEVYFEGEGEMSWDITTHGYLMRLSGYVPELLNGGLEKLVASGLNQSVFNNPKLLWAIHPGGKKILNNLGEYLKLSDWQLKPAMQVLANYGNMSSPTVLFVMQLFFNEQYRRDEEELISLAFGPGLTLEAINWKWDDNL